MTFNIYEQEKEPYIEAQKTRFLPDKVMHPDPKTAIVTLNLCNDVEGGITYTTAANHLSTQVSKLPEFNHVRNIGAVNNFKDGEINMDHYDNWNALTQDQKDKVLVECRHSGINKKKGKGKAAGTTAKA